MGQLWLKIIFAFFCLMGIVAYTPAVLAEVSLQRHHALSFMALGTGCALYVFAWLLHLSGKTPFWSVVEHEFTHALFALLTFKKVHSISVNRTEGGKISIGGDNFLIALAPYFFPLTTVFWLVIKPSVATSFQWVLNLLLGASLMFHFVHLAKEFHPSQPDLQKSGLIFACVVVLFFNLFFVGLTLASLEGDWLAMSRYIVSGLDTGHTYMIEVWNTVLPEESVLRVSN